MRREDDGTASRTTLRRRSAAVYSARLVCPRPRLDQAVANLDALVQLVGMPDERAMQRQVGQLEHVLNDAADNLARELTPKLMRLPRSLLEHPDYRLTGAMEAIQQLENVLVQSIEHYEPLLNDMAAKAIDGYYAIHTFLNAERGRRRPSPAEIAESLRNFPKWRYQNLIHRQVCRIYMTLRSNWGSSIASSSSASSGSTI